MYLDQMSEVVYEINNPDAKPIKQRLIINNG